MSGLRERTPDSSSDDTGESAAERAASLSKAKATRNLNTQFQIDPGQPADDDWPPLSATQNTSGSRQKQKVDDKNTIDRLRSKVKAVRAEAAKNAEEHSAQLIEKQKRIDELEQRVAGLVAQEQKSVAEKADVVIKRDREEAARIEAERQAKELGEKIEQLQKERKEETAKWKKETEERNKKYTVEIYQIAQSMGTLEGQCDSLRKEMEEATLARDEAVAEASRLRAAATDLQHNLSEAERRCREAETAMAAAESALSKAGYVRSALEDSHARFAKMKNERDVLVAARYVDEQTAVGLRRKMRGLETVVEKARAACDEEKRLRRAAQESLKIAEEARQQAEKIAEQSKMDLNEAKVHLSYVKKQHDKLKGTLQREASTPSAAAAADTTTMSAALPTPRARGSSIPAARPTPPPTPAGSSGSATPATAAASAAALITPSTRPSIAASRATSMMPLTPAVLNASSFTVPSSVTASSKAPVPGRSRLLADLLLPGKNVILPDLAAIGFPSCPSLFNAIVQVSNAWVERGNWYATKRSPPYHLTVWDGSPLPETIAQKGRLLRQLTTPRDKMIVGRPSSHELIAARSIDVRLVEARKVEAGDFVLLHDVIIVKALSGEEEQGGEEGENFPSWRLEARDLTVLKEPRSDELEALALRAAQLRVAATTLLAAGREEEAAKTQELMRTEEEERRASAVSSQEQLLEEERPSFSFVSSRRRPLHWRFELDPVLTSRRPAVKRRREEEDEVEQEADGAPSRKVFLCLAEGYEEEQNAAVEERGREAVASFAAHRRKHSVFAALLAQLMPAMASEEEEASEAAAAAARVQQQKEKHPITIASTLAQLDRKPAGEEAGATATAAAAAPQSTWVEELAGWEVLEKDGVGQELQLSTGGSVVPPLAYYGSAEANAARYADFISALSADPSPRYPRGQVWLCWMRTCHTNSVIVERRTRERTKCPQCEGPDCAVSLYAHIPLERPGSSGDYVHLLVDGMHFRESGSNATEWKSFRSQSEKYKTSLLTKIAEKINTSTLVLHRADVMSLNSKRVYVVGREPSWITVGER